VRGEKIFKIREAFRKDNKKEIVWRSLEKTYKTTSSAAPTPEFVDPFCSSFHQF